MVIFNSNKQKPDLVKRAQEKARRNPFLAIFIIIGLAVIALGSVINNLDNIITFCRKYFFGDVEQGESIQSNPKSDSSLPSTDKITAFGRRAAPWNNEYGGDRRSYLRLLYLKDTITDAVRKDWVTTEIERVEKSYPVDVMRLNIDNWGVICIPHFNCSKGYENSTGFSASNVINHLGFNRDLWQERARAACVLRKIKKTPDKGSVNKESFYEKLISLMGEKENSLCVSKMAFETYKDLTGFPSDGVFDFEGAIKDWKKRKEEILKTNF